jgi:hypothetical protein
MQIINTVLSYFRKPETSTHVYPITEESYKYFYRNLTTLNKAFKGIFEINLSITRSKKVRQYNLIVTKQEF